MKGAIADCLSKLVISKYGRENWEKILEMSGLSSSTIFLPIQDVADTDVLKVVDTVCNVLNISLEELAGDFGDYWMNVYAVKTYKMYYKGNSAKEFILNMDNVHQMVTQNIENAHPPRFEYNWENSNTLNMKYKSKRNLIDFVVGLIKGVGRFYKEDLKVSKLGNDTVRVTFVNR